MSGIRDRVKSLRRVRASELVANPQNWRTHPTNQKGALQAMLADVGFAAPLIARERKDGKLELIDGHLRAELGKGDEKVPVVVLDVTEEEADKLLATLDPIGALAGRDSKALEKLLDGLRLDSAGLDEMFEELLGQESANKLGLTDPNEVPEVPKTSWVKPGEMFTLGDHRILCGSSTDEKDIARLMGGERAGLMNTDPPYGISYDAADVHVGAKSTAKIANDELADEKLQSFLESAFRPAKELALRENAAWYLWHAHLTQGFFAAAAAAAANVVLHRQIIWVKPGLILGRGQYHWRHEPCFMGWVRGKSPPDFGEGNGERTQTTIWEVDGVPRPERQTLDHPTPKPVRLFEIPMVKHLKRNEIAYEPFSGSGPQIIAAEKTGRRCFALELEPRYVQAAVERWQKYTGRKAESCGAPRKAKSKPKSVARPSSPPR